MNYCERCTVLERHWLRYEIDTVLTDNDPELTSNTVPAWCDDVGIERHRIARDRARDNPLVVTLSGRLRDQSNA